MKRIDKRLRPYCILLSVISLGIIFVFYEFIFQSKDFYINSDQVTIYNLYYKEWIRLLNEFFSGNGLPLYSWYDFLGSDFYSSLVVNVNTDIFIPFLLLFENIEVGLLYETIICIFISGYTMYLFLSSCSISDIKLKIFISVIYSFSGWAILLYGNYMFHRFYAFLPLLFYTINNFVNRNNCWKLIIISALLFSQNYYFMFSTLIFTFFYCIVTLLEKKYDLKTIIVKVIQIYCLLFIGFMIVGIFLIPGILYLLSNPRVGHAAPGIFWEFNTYIGFIINLISSPFPTYSGYDNLFLAGTNGHQYWYSLQIGMIPLISIISIIKEKKYRYNIIIVSIFLLVLCFKPFSSIIHGFFEPSIRWTFLLVFYLLYLSAKSLNEKKLNKLDMKIVTYSSVLLILVLVLLLIIKGYSFVEYKAHLISILFV